MNYTKAMKWKMKSILFVDVIFEMQSFIVFLKLLMSLLIWVILRNVYNDNDYENILFDH